MNDSDLIVDGMVVLDMSTRPEDAGEWSVRSVAEMDADLRPQERALKYGVGILSVSELWALILRSGLRGKPITELCRDLMNDCHNSLFQLERMSLEDILDIKGLGQIKALQVMAVMELIRRYNAEKARDLKTIGCSADIYKVMSPNIGNLDHEEIWVLLLNRRNQVTDYIRLTTGSATASLFDLKGLMRKVLVRRAESIIMCHNHPSGQLRPSPQDDDITRRLRQACQTMDIRMLDHLIVTAHGYYSYSDQGKL